MLKKLIVVFFLFSLSIQSQNVVMGTMIPINEEFKWIALYQLKDSKQVYKTDAILENGKFSLEIPQNSPSGMYRLRYKMDNQSVVDFIYNNENIDLQFDPEKPFETVEFLDSEENKIYNSYLLKSNEIKQQLDALQYSYFSLQSENEKRNAAKSYESSLNYYHEIQQKSEINSKGKLANHFIKANHKYYAQQLIETPQEYLNSEKKHFFDYIDFLDEILNNSTFISEFVLNYVFYLNVSEDANVQQLLYKNAINEVLTKMDENVKLKSDVITTLMYSFSQTENLLIIDYLLENYYDKLPKEYKNNTDIKIILDKVKFAIGRTAPNFTWEENSETKSLYNLNKAETYVLVFWSTSCSHCILEIPELYEYTKDKSNLHVIDIALENDTVEFDKYVQKFEKWTNVLGLGKWGNVIARSYEIVSTPTYFILDANKKIIEKPEFFEDVKVFFNN